jgi:diguanylate cyclase (GGDEF)-like protein
MGVDRQSAPLPERRAVAAWMGRSISAEAARLTLAVMFCLGVLWFDVATSSDTLESLLHPLAFVALYPVSRRWSVAALAAVAIGCVALAHALEPAGEALEQSLINHGMIVLTIVGIAYLLDRVCLAERELHRLATTDPLTGAFNRRFGDALLRLEVKRAERYRATFGVLIVDIDHFKRLNDTRGHAAGDQALAAMAATARRALRPSDALCRFGGEEFVAVLPQADRSGSLAAAERIRAAVEQLRMPNLPDVRMSVSVGVASFVAGASVEDMLAAADKALYQAKASGRNQTRIAGWRRDGAALLAEVEALEEAAPAPLGLDRRAIRTA